MQSHHASKVRTCAARLAIAAGLAMSLPPLRSASAQDVLTPRERRGKQIYVQGTSPSGGEVLAYLGEASLEVPGATMACANCHGLDGRGKPEGGVTPSDLSWESLTKPYGVTHASGRRHPPYTERALELALARGLDPAGNRLSNVMPRYQMSREDMADLVAYLKRVGNDSDLGVTEKSINVGTLVPAAGELAGTGQAVKAVLAAFFSEVNSQGGIYNRKIELKFAETAATPAATAANARRFIQDERLFAITSAFTAGADKEVAALAEELGVPFIGPLTIYPQTGHPLNRHVFYLLSGVEEQARALVNFACRKSPARKGGVLVVSPEGEMWARVAEAVKAQCQKSGCGAVQVRSYRRASFDAPALAGELSRTDAEAVFFLGTGEEASALMKEADRLRWLPSLYLPGAGGSGIFDAPLSFSGKVFLSFPTSPADQTAEGVGEFRALAAKYNLPAHHLAAQLSAYSAAKVLVEGLKRAGRDVSREKLVGTLEGFAGFTTGLTPALTYGPNRRIGALGAYVVTIDLEKRQFQQASPWVDTN